MAHNSFAQGASLGSTSEFAKVITSRSLSPSNRRRSSTTAFESRYAHANTSSQQPNRRFSNPTTPNISGYSNTSSDSRSRSPSDPQVFSDRSSLANQRRRFSQPVASSAGYSYTSTTNASLIRQERESYSSLSYLPEVRAYLRFMEDDTHLPHRSNSFNGRNSSRRSSFNRRKRSLSRPRTPTPTPANSFHSDYPIAFDQTDPPNQFYGRYLTPQRSTERSANRLSVDYVEPNTFAFGGSREELSHLDNLAGAIRTSFI